MNYYYSIIIAVFIISCTSKTDKLADKKYGYKVSLKPTGKKIKFSLDSLTSENSMTTLLVELNGREYFYFYNRPTNEILSYDVETRKIANRVPIKTEGVDKIGRISGFQIKTVDSIYVFPIGRSSIFIVNERGKILNEIKYNAPETQSEAYVISALNSVPNFLTGDSFILKSLPSANWARLENDELSKFTMSYKVFLKSGQLQQSKHFYPESYWKEFKKDIQFSMVSNDSLIVYSIFGDHNLYYAKSIDEKLKAKYAKSSNISRNFDEIPVGEGREKMLSYFAFSPHYKSIYFDKFRNVYYRFCNTGYDEIFEVEDLNHYRKYPRNFSIIVLDSKLRIIDEWFVENNRRYNIDNVLVGKRGLYISLNNPLNDDSDEDYFAFELFSFE